MSVPGTDGEQDDQEHRGPVDHVLDLVVFVPFGFLCQSRTLLPQLAETGRQQVGQRVQLARMIGQFAVQQGQRQALKVVGNLRSPARPAEPEAEPAPASTAAALPAPAPAVAPAPADLPPPAPVASPPDEDVVAVRAESSGIGDSDGAPERAAEGEPDTELAPVAEADLAIPAYDSLAASQVVPRLEGLTTAELEAVRRYELTHRGRKTVLGKITLLQSRS